MPKRSSKDINQIAADVVRAATAEAQKPIKHRKNPNAVALGRRGGLKGGKARKEALTSEQRAQIAQKAAAARWAKK